MISLPEKSPDQKDLSMKNLMRSSRDFLAPKQPISCFIPWQKPRRPDWGLITYVIK
jgi:hypothetical protein